MKTKKKVAYILLGNIIPNMNKSSEATLKNLSQETDPLILICGFPHEVAYYQELVKSSGITATVYSSDKSWDTFSNFSKDISSLLKEHQITTKFTLFASPSHAWRIQRVVKYMTRWHKAFKSCSFQVIGDPTIPAYSLENIANIFYHFGYVGMYALMMVSYYRRWKKSSE